MREATMLGFKTRWEERPDPVSLRTWQWLASRTLPALKWMVGMVMLLAVLALWAVGIAFFCYGIVGIGYLVWDHPWVAIVILIGIWIYACHNSERVANTTSVVAFCALIAIPLIFFVAAMALSAPFICAAEAPILATIAIVGSVIALLLFGGGA